MLLNYIKINNLGGFKVKSGMLQHLIENAHLKLKFTCQLFRCAQMLTQGSQCLNQEQQKSTAETKLILSSSPLPRPCPLSLHCHPLSFITLCYFLFLPVPSQPLSQL